MKKRVLFGLRVLCFALLATLAVRYATYVLTPKHDYGICSMSNLYRQPDNSVDVLVVGTSVAYAGINTNVLWEEYGIAAYDLCSAEQPFWIAYYTLKEALKTQSPKVVLLDAKPAMYTQDYSKRGRTILSTYGIRGIENRTGAVLACLEDQSQAPGYILGLPQVHSNYNAVKADDFVYPADNGGRGVNWKGYIEEDKVEAHDCPTIMWNGTRRSMNDREEEYVRKIFELCRERDVELMLIGMPNPDYANDHEYYNDLWAVAWEYGITGINYNVEDKRRGLNYGTDFADWQHLNVKGSVTFSKQLGKDLVSKYDLPDRRGDAAYASYEACAKDWYALYPTFTSAGVRGV